MRTSSLLFALALVGCGDDGGTATNPDTSLPASTVSGSARTLFFNDGGQTMRPIDLSGVTIQAIVGAQTVTGQGRADGSFTIDNVPETEYMLRVDREIFVTSARTHVLDDIEHGRADGVVSTAAGTSLNFTINGVATWQATDVFQMYIPNSGTFLFNLELDLMPAVGATSIAGTVDYQLAAFPEPVLIDSTKGDVARVAQMTTQNVAGAAVQVLAKSAEVMGINQVDGQITAITAALADFTQAQSYVLDFKRSQFAALRPPGVTDFSQFLGLQAQPAELARESVSAVDLVLGNFSPAATDLGPATVMYGDPFPTAWERFVGAGSFYQIMHTVPGTSVQGRRFVSNSVEQAPTGPLVPLVGPPGNIQIDPATRMTTWTAPSLGTSAWYEVVLVRVFAEGTTARSETIARITTSATSVAIPSALMTSGMHYYVRVAAYATSASIGPPRRLARPHGRADAVSDIFTAS